MYHLTTGIQLWNSKCFFNLQKQFYLLYLHLLVCRAHHRITNPVALFSCKTKDFGIHQPLLDNMYACSHMQSHITYRFNSIAWACFNTDEPPHDKTNKMTVRPAKTQIRPVWSESSLCAKWVAKDPSFFHADSEDSDQTGRMPRLIWVFAWRTCHFIGFVMRRLRY